MKLYKQRCRQSCVLFGSQCYLCFARGYKFLKFQIGVNKLLLKIRSAGPSLIVSLPLMFNARHTMKVSFPRPIVEPLFEVLARKEVAMERRMYICLHLGRAEFAYFISRSVSPLITSRVVRLYKFVGKSNFRFLTKSNNSREAKFYLID